MSLLATFFIAGCDLFTGPDRRVMGIIAVMQAGMSSSEQAVIANPGTDVCVWFCLGEDQCVWLCGHDEPMLETPDTVEAGVPFEVTAWPLIPIGYRDDRTDVSRTGSTIELTPYYYKYRGDVVYPNVGGSELRPRQIELVFPEAGEGVVRLMGRALLLQGDSAVEERFGWLERTVVVQ